MQVDVGRRASRVGAKIDFFAENFPTAFFTESLLTREPFFIIVRNNCR
jgi:hypothetical protein